MDNKQKQCLFDVGVLSDEALEGELNVTTIENLH